MTITTTNKTDVSKAITTAINDMRNHEFEIVKKPTNISFGTVQQCKALLREIFLEVDKTIDKKNFKWLPEYDQVAAYLSNNQGKGLAMLGNSGRGKSIILFRILPVLFRMLRSEGCPNGLIVKPLPAFDLSKTDVFAYSKRKIFAIDELGREPKFNDYGEKYEALDYIIDNAERNAKLLYFTTNSKPKGIEDRYGKHFLDRLNKLCTFIEFVGPSLRK
jgi:DNA replication protein DnaC